MKYIYLTESVTAHNATLPDIDNDAVEHLAFLDVKTFKKLRKKIKARYGKQVETKDADQKLVIMYSTPVAVIASGLRSQIEDTQLVAQWCQQAEALVELFKQYQSHCILANLNALKADMTDLVKLVRMNKKERAIFNTISTNTANADIYTLSAHYMISNDDQLSRQLNMLDACTTFNEFSEDACNIQTILNQQQVKANQQDVELKNAQTALEQQQAEMTSVNQKLAALSNQITKEKETVSQTKNQYDAEIEQLQNTIKQISQEKDTAAAQLQASQNEAKSQLEKTQSAIAEKDALTNLLKSAQTDLANQTAENEQIIEQLHLVQEAFEESILETNKLKTKTTNLEKQIERTESHQAWFVKELLVSHKKLNAKSWSYRGMLKKQVANIRASGLFDEAWYLETYPEVAESKMPPILHYLLYGVIEAKNPSPEFNTKNYLSIYFDVAQHGMNPFIHYINSGQAEGRKADPLQKRLPSPKDQ